MSEHATPGTAGLSTPRARWGILGTGFIAGLQTPDLIDNGSLVQAVGSRTMASATDFAARFQIPTSHGSYADLEKPFAMNAWQAREIVELAETKGLIALEAMWTRYLPHMVRIRELIRSGALGEVRTVIADHNQNLPKDPAHRLNDPALGGGALLDLGIYPVSFAFDVFGAPTGIRAAASMTETGVDRQTAMIFEYGGGQQAVLHCALDTAGPNQASIIGTEGRIEIPSVWYTPSAFTRYDADGNIVERFDEPVTGRGMQYQAREMERLIAAGSVANDILPPRQSVQVMEAMDEVRRQIGLAYASDDKDHGRA